MNRRQKLILAIFAIIDVVVVAALGAVVYLQSRPPAAATPTPALELPVWPCAASLSQPLNDRVTPTLAWTEQRLTVALSISATTPSTDTVQALWTVLDRLASAHLHDCWLPPEIVLTLTVTTPETKEHATAVVATADLERWAGAGLRDSDFAALVRYRAEALMRSPWPARPARPR